jgi:hypothetical protein
VPADTVAASTAEITADNSRPLKLSAAPGR